MTTNNTMSFNGQIYKKVYQRLHLSPTNRIIFQRLLGFLIRNDSPFPYSAVKLAEITGFCKRTIFNSLNELERCRLIERIGEGKNRRFKRGSILVKIMSTVQNSIKKELSNYSPTVQHVPQNLNNRARGAYKKTSSSLKHKEREFVYDPLYQEYVGKLESGKALGLISDNVHVMSYEEWIKKAD
jgi:hypothetical protein